MGTDIAFFNPDASIGHVAAGAPLALKAISEGIGFVFDISEYQCHQELTQNAVGKKFSSSASAVRSKLRCRVEAFSAIELSENPKKKHRITTKPLGGADEDQTHDLVIANDALYQLSYCP